MKWVIINDSYLDYLRKNGDTRIPYSNYGTDKYKPFFGELFTIGDYSYVTQVTSYKERLERIKEDKDFYKIYRQNKLVAAVNLNYMFPILTSKLKYLDNYNDISQYRTFKSGNEKSKYISFLKYELSEINKKPLTISAKFLYNVKYDKPNNKISKRCLDFKKLETICSQYFKILKIQQLAQYNQNMNENKSIPKM